MSERRESQRLPSPDNTPDLGAIRQAFRAAIPPVLTLHELAVSTYPLRHAYHEFALGREEGVERTILGERRFDIPLPINEDGPQHERTVTILEGNGIVEATLSERVVAKLARRFQREGGPTSEEVDITVARALFPVGRFILPSGLNGLPIEARVGDDLGKVFSPADYHDDPAHQQGFISALQTITAALLTR